MQCGGAIIFISSSNPMPFSGNKDLQQRVIIEQMVASLNLKIDIVGCPIIRDKEGLP